MIAVDANLLIYAHRRDSPFHGPARQWLTELTEGSTPWAIPWPCIHEFLSIVTHPRIYRPPSTSEEAIDQVDAWREAPTLTLLGEGDGYWESLKALMLSGGSVGGQVHDARIAALCAYHGISELCTADRDFSRYPSVTVRNPLVQK